MNRLLTVTFCSSLLLAAADAAEPSLAELLDKVRQGDAPAQLALAIRHRDAKGVEKDHTEAMRWAHRAADAGNADAMDFVGFAYLRGAGVKRNPVLAFGYFQEAAETSAQLPEFKGNVATVLAEKHGGRELKAARRQEAKLKKQAKKLTKDGTMKPAEEGAALEKLRATGLTERERQVLEKGVSNLEFHYLCSAQFLGGAGKGLAEATAALNQLKPAK